MPLRKRGQVQEVLRGGHEHVARAEPRLGYKFTRRDIGTAITFKLAGTAPAVFVIRTAWRIRRRRD